MTKEMRYGKDYKFLPTTSFKTGKWTQLASDVFQYTCQIVNLFIIGKPASGRFVLVDTGTPYRAQAISAAVEERFGAGARCEAIILTHGHFDHVGSVIELVEKYAAPVYAHELELPYLTGQQDYPTPDASVEGGLVAKMSPIFPVDAIDLGDHVQQLPEDGHVPALPEFRWVHVPGHSPGQVALFRERDRLLLSADAIVTVRQEDLYKVLTQKQEISGPPRYLTTDWGAARASVEKLVALKPLIMGTGHGLPMGGENLRENLQYLVEHFDEIGIPDHGRFVEEDEVQ